ncbi:hypothetical protein [Silvanigrella sp.]|jgi:hypothetical protein|uniref:hypothetical protein n=1 Tax=Silvanigrella sp. TaxID=2024976 RepID=UPI0037CBAB09
MIKFIALNLFISTSFCAFSIEKNNYFEIKCDKQKCFAVAKLNGKLQKITEIYDKNKANIIWLTKDLASLHLNCGSPCSNSTYIDFEENKISKNYPLVISTDPKLKIVAYVNDKNELEISKIFKGKTKIVKLDFSPTASIFTAISEVEFINKNLVKINYISGESYVSKTTEVNISDLEN